MATHSTDLPQPPSSGASTPGSTTSAGAGPADPGPGAPVVAAGPVSGPVSGAVSGAVSGSGIEVVRSEERLVAGVERHVTGSVRIGKRVVTEERTVTVTVRREELVVEHLPASAAAAGAGIATDRDTSRPVITLTLSEEQPEVSVRVVPRETVRVFVDRVTVDHAVTDSVAREVVEHDVVGTGAAATDRTAGGHAADR